LRRPDRREERKLPDLHREFLLVGAVAERPGHAAAPAVERAHTLAGKATEERPGGLRAPERLLMAMAVEKDRANVAGIPSGQVRAVGPAWMFIPETVEKVFHKKAAIRDRSALSA